MQASKVMSVVCVQSENDSLQEQISAMIKELEITKEKLNTLEQAWEKVNTVGK